MAAALVLGGLSLYLNQDWFSHDGIQIYHRSRAARSGLFRRKKSPPARATPQLARHFWL